MVNAGIVLDQILTGLSIGSWLFLVSIGLSLVFGVLGVLNFAHGVLFAMGAYVTVSAVSSSIGNFWIGVVAAGVVVGVLGIIIEMGFIRRLYGRAEEELEQLLLTFAFVLILEDGIRMVFGSGTRQIDPPSAFGFDIVVAGYSMSSYRVFVILVSFAVMGGILLTLKTTNFGRLVRATSSDRDMASLLGVNVPRLYTMVFFIGAALAGIGGAFAAPLQSVTPALGETVIIEAFIIVVIGGLGSFVGTFFGAYLVGIMIAVGSIFAAGAGQLFPFIALILVLLLKPEGLTGGANT
ncbi:branched-chain amino acid ABC transporter permease [Natronomonas sp. F2-12]|jgi:branched-chain amino acid transport system permease protein|uniref:Branched-chain amino acid ABC transporter permease n=1 Tax=Natronomonas aquatica TaxID=2841590 RepID=A0A9R1D6H1_9EURY|nr:branched-chain amino acid ABC transporter permease [Natronomonas aquatica]MCQ4332035.1 branched-chain amino acid ABC transporter permease [Natronomonas aquatica]